LEKEVNGCGDVERGNDPLRDLGLKGGELGFEPNRGEPLEMGVAAPEQWPFTDLLGG